MPTDKPRRVRITGEGMPREIAPNVYLSYPLSFELPGQELEGARYTVSMTLDMVSGAIRPTAVTVSADEGSPPVTGTILRAVKVSELSRMVLLAAVHRGRPDFQEHVVSIEPDSLTVSDAEQATIRQAGPTDESLAAVAFFYNLAMLIGGPPARYVELKLGLPRTTASKWVRRAREKGLILDGVDPEAS